MLHLRYRLFIDQIMNKTGVLLALMEFLYVTFPISGVQTWVFIPPLAAFVVSFFTSMGGISGAFILLPFQMSILGYTAPSVSATNQLFNIVATPSGVWRYLRENRMLWHLTWVVSAGSLPGVFVGAWLRLEFLPDPQSFKFFAGLVLLYLGGKLFFEVINSGQRSSGTPTIKSNRLENTFVISNSRFSLKTVDYEFNGQSYSFSVPLVFVLCMGVGVVGGIYGIGGGAIIAPFLVTIFSLPVYTVAGAALMATFVTSVAGVFFYQLLAPIYSSMLVAPDWYLGAAMGIGGFYGIYLGARCQKYVPSMAIKLILCFCVMFVALKYIIGFIW